MPHYVRSIDEHRWEIWQIEEDRATRVGVTNPPVHEAEPGQIWERIDQVFGDGARSSFVQLELEPGYYHRRMYRYTSHADSSYTFAPEIPEEDRSYAAMARSQLNALIAQLFSICETIQPIGGNLKSYGHSTRNLLILSCTEVEMHLKGVLNVNGVSKDRMNIRDYAHVSAPLKLREYELSFPAFPWLEPFRPFSEFGTEDGFSHVLTWYQAYNAVKHDRENEFKNAELGNVFNAVAACAILLVAQFGWAKGLIKGSELSRQFHFIREPHFERSQWYHGSIFCESETIFQAKDFDFQLGLR